MNRFRKLFAAAMAALACCIGSCSCFHVLSNAGIRTDRNAIELMYHPIGTWSFQWGVRWDVAQFELAHTLAGPNPPVPGNTGAPSSLFHVGSGRIWNEQYHWIRLPTILLIAILLSPLMYELWRGPLRRRRRIRLGQCVGCGYSLTGLPEPRCPECGRAVESSALPDHAP